MSPATDGPVRLVDEPEESGRTTATLLASLAGRLGILHYVTGAGAVGSLVAGFAALGREVSLTAEGRLLRRSLEAGRATVNGETLWTELKIRDWLAGVPASPVLDHLRNDLALLLAGDLDETLALMPIPSHPAGESGEENDETAEFLDCVVGLWAFSRELVRAVESLVAPTRVPPGLVETAPVAGTSPEGSLLR